MTVAQDSISNSSSAAAALSRPIIKEASITGLLLLLSLMQSKRIFAGIDSFLLESMPKFSRIIAICGIRSWFGLPESNAGIAPAAYRLSKYLLVGKRESSAAPKKQRHRLGLLGLRTEFIGLGVERKTKNAIGYLSSKLSVKIRITTYYFLSKENL